MAKVEHSEDCKQAIGVDCLEKIIAGLNTSGEIKKMSEGDLAAVLAQALGNNNGK